MATSNYPEQTDNLISNVFDILPDKILQLLTIRDAARTSVLSKQWRCNWLSLKHLVFDYDFFNDESGNLQKYNSIISSILLNHDGPIHEFTLNISQGTNEMCLNLNQWLSFLSKNDVRRIRIGGLFRMPISSNIFWCTELIHLDLFDMIIHPPPSGFNGFPNLQYLVLALIQFSREYIFPSLMAKCPKLASLKLYRCSGMGDIVIDAPNLETLIIFDFFEWKSITLRDVRNLKSIGLQLYNSPKKSQKIDSFDNLASSRQLQCIKFNGVSFKFLAAGGFNRALAITFNHLSELSLCELFLSDPGVLGNIFDILECCPYIKELFISIHKSGDNANDHRLGCTKVYKSPHLVEVKIIGITGSAMELQLIEYLFTIAVALERLQYKSNNCDTESKLKLLGALSGMPRASPKARLISLM